MKVAGAPPKSPTGWLLLRSRGGLWGIPRDTFRELVGRTPQRIELTTGETLVADELLSLAVGLEWYPFPRCVRPFCPAGPFGLAVWHGEPVVLLAPGAAPPDCLRMMDTEPETSEMGGDSE